MPKKQRLYRLINHIPIRWRLVLLILGLLALLLSASSAIISNLAEQSLLTNQVDVLHQESQLAMRGIKGHYFAPFNIAYPAGTPSPGFKAAASELVHRLISPTTNAALLSADGTILIPGSPQLFSAPSVTLPPAQVRQMLAAHYMDGSYMLVKDTLGRRQMVVLIPLVDNLHTVGVLQISTPTAPIDQFLATLRLLLFSGMICTLGLAAVLIFPLVSVALHPLVEIERMSRQIARGALSMRIDPPPTHDEIGRLALSFNRMVAQLEAAFQRQKRFVSNVSHELRTPLTALSGSLEMLLIGADRGDVEASRRLAHGMYTEIQRLHRLVEDLLALTQLDTGKIALRADIVYVDSVIHKVYEMAQHLLSGQKLHYRIASDLPPVRIDEDRLQQILLNIVDNAIKFTPTDGSVEILARSEVKTTHITQSRRSSDGHIETLARSEGWETVLIQIHDTGQGIPSDALPHVFDRFYRADPSRSRSSQYAGGNGLGLAISRELTEAQGGSLAIESKLGEGTTVTLCLQTVRQPEPAKRLAKKR
ncbi:MAG TPA: HAMP domain-containing sensor histidine kinase [Ktedonobacteraceae bacterium]|jgi:two-component system OmpR family sensor kinase